MKKRFVVVLSTGGSVFLNTIPRFPDLFDCFVLIISDRQCEGLLKAEKVGFRTAVQDTRSPWEFSDFVLETCQANQVDYIFSFYTKLFRGKLLDAYEGHIVNFHPSLLPAAAGRRGFQESLASGARIIGATAHIVEAGMDTGPQILQSTVVVDPNMNQVALRHQVFIAQCRQLIQVCDWICADRLRVSDRNVVIADATFRDSANVPTLDSERARTWGVEPYGSSHVVS